VNGKLHYDMIADTPEMVAAMKEMGLPVSHVERARFSEFRPLERLVLSLMMDFLPGVEPYESTIMVDFFPIGEWVRMVVTPCPMHNEEFTKMAAAGLASQLRNLDKRFQSRTWLECPPPVAAP
jgi:hypothetical protein